MGHFCKAIRFLPVQKTGKYKTSVYRSKRSSRPGPMYEYPAG